MPATLRKHVRYPELLLEMQAAVYGLYHMMDPEVFYNREDLWTVASEVTMNAQREQSAQPMEPNFVLMKLPGERVDRVRGDAAVHAGKSQQPDRMDCRPERRSALRKDHRLQLSEDQARRRTAANRGAHRSERAAVGTVLAVEPAGLERAPRRPDRDPDRTGAALRRTDLSAGRTQPDARAAARRAGAAGPRSPTARRSRRRWRPSSERAHRCLRSTPRDIATRAPPAPGSTAAGRPPPLDGATQLRCRRAHRRRGARSRGLSASHGRGPARATPASASRR